MIFMELFLDQDKTSYHMSMILIYILFLTITFVICLIISNKLNIYNNKENKSISTKIDNENELQLQLMNEIAVAAGDIRGTEDEQ